MSRLTKYVSVAGFALLASSGAAQAEEILIGLITKTETNPFFAKMREGAELKAAELGATLQSFAGKNSEDNESQVAAIESLIAAGAKGILLVANDTNAITVAVQKARDAGILVVALDTPLDPVDAADATFATDNFRAGELIGRWAAGHLGEEAANARIAFLDAVESQVSVDYMRDQGFMAGFGIDIMEPNHYGEETDPRIVGHQWTGGSEEGGRTGMENLLQKDPSVNLVYTVNEPSAAGAYEALKAAGRENDVTIVSIDGGCPGVADVEAGVIGATAQQYPLQMATFGVEAVVRFVQTGVKPEPGAGYDFIDTGVELVTDQPVAGLPSIDSAAGLKVCWG